MDLSRHLVIFKKFFLDFSVMQENGLIRKIRLISNFMMPQPGSQTIIIHILPNISRSKTNQTMKFSQLIEYNMGKFIFKNHTQNVVENYSQTLFQKIQFDHISGSLAYSFTPFVLIVYQVEGYRNILKLSCRHLAFTLC